MMRGGTFRLDGGSMFGLVPRVVWSKSCQTDDRGRIPVQHNCLLLERVGDSPDGAGFAPKLLVIEVGSGDKLDAKSRDIFGLEDRSILDGLHELDCRPEDVGGVVVTHLHFDHAGGLTRKPRVGEAGGAMNAVPTFPNAAIVSQAREWSDAIANRSVMTRTYFRDHLDPIASQMTLVDSPPPFGPGEIVDRDQRPLAPVELRRTEVAPGVFVFRCPGHTWGQQAVMFTDTKGRTVVFTPDVLPTAWHVGAAYSLAYDVEPYTSMVSKRWFLESAAAHDWLLVLDHEPGNPVRRVRSDGKGWYELHEDSV